MDTHFFTDNREETKTENYEERKNMIEKGKRRSLTICAFFA